MENWAPLLKWGIIRFLLLGIGVSVFVATFSIAFSLLFGTLLAVIRTERVRGAALLAAAYVEGIRSLPSFLIVIYVYFTVYRSGVTVPAVSTVILGLTIYHSAKVAEIVRGGIKAIKPGIWEAALSLGMTRMQILRYLVLPVAFRRSLAPLTSEMVVAVKNTTLGSLVGVNEILYRGVLVYQQYRNPVETLVFVSIGYLTVNGLLARASRYLERLERSEAIGATVRE